ncbi:MAG: GNAT family N-acetyltransferase [Coriobacteriia bacterium]
MSGPAFREPTGEELAKLERMLVTARVFGNGEEMRSAIAGEPWRIRTTDGGEVAVLSRWRDHLPVLAIDALWCATSAIPCAVQALRRLGWSVGLSDMVSPPIPVEETGPYEAAGMRVHTVVATFALAPLGATHVARNVRGLTIRRARKGDVPVVMRVDAACFDSFWRYDRRHLERFCDTGRLALAEVDGMAVGYTLCTVDADDGLLGRLCVVPGMRRRHIGSALLAEAVSFVGRAGGSRVTLSTQVDNQPSQALYRSASFSDTGRRYAFLRFGAEKGR